jgi:hypothetical protein
VTDRFVPLPPHPTPTPQFVLFLIFCQCFITSQTQLFCCPHSCCLLLSWSEVRNLVSCLSFVALVPRSSVRKSESTLNRPKPILRNSSPRTSISRT